MLTAVQFMDGSKQLATAAKVRDEHARCALVPFDRTMYAQAAEALRHWSEDLARWSRSAAEHEAGVESIRDSKQLEIYSKEATRLLAQLLPAEKEVEA